jgi:hypothetical protein
MDNSVLGATYNGVALTITGAKTNWGATKTVVFSAVDKGELIIEGNDYEDGNTGHCATAGFTMYCQSTDTSSPWHRLSTNQLDRFTAAGSTSVTTGNGPTHSMAGATYGPYDPPCTSTSGFSMTASDGKQHGKIWAASGARSAKIRTTAEVNTITCSEQNSCNRVTILGNAVCSGIGSCGLANIIGDATCSGEWSCHKANITGDATCNGLESCPRALIANDADCTGPESCWIARVRHDAECSGDSSCKEAIVTNFADCSASESCYEARIGEWWWDLTDGPSACYPYSCPKTSGDAICTGERSCEYAFIYKYSRNALNPSDLRAYYYSFLRP